jgi:hypothetical protein
LNISSAYSDFTAFKNDQVLTVFELTTWKILKYAAIIEAIPFMFFMIVVLFDQIVIVLNRPSTLERVREHEGGPKY